MKTMERKKETTEEQTLEEFMSLLFECLQIRDLLIVAETSPNDKEAEAAMKNLRKINPTYHWCPDWDYAVFCADDREAEGCTCDITKGKGRRNKANWK